MIQFDSESFVSWSNFINTNFVRAIYYVHALGKLHSISLACKGKEPLEKQVRARYKTRGATNLAWRKAQSFVVLDLNLDLSLVNQNKCLVQSL